MNIDTLLEPIHNFLQCSTPDAWLVEAQKPENLAILLRDHLICELKAAQSAALLLSKYAVNAEGKAALLQWLKPYEDFAYLKRGDLISLQHITPPSKKLLAGHASVYNQSLIDKMVLLIKEELHHFYQVLEMMTAHQIPYESTSASRYAKGLIRHVTTYEPNALIDKLIIGAFIEARSCERFAKLAPYLADDLQSFYISLLRSEARHYQDYLALAYELDQADKIDQRIAFFRQCEADLIETEDPVFRFHSGQPQHAMNTQNH